MRIAVGYTNSVFYSELMKILFHDYKRELEYEQPFFQVYVQLYVNVWAPYPITYFVNLNKKN